VSDSFGFNFGAHVVGEFADPEQLAQKHGHKVSLMAAAS
jgi:hypothetical protein